MFLILFIKLYLLKLLLKMQVFDPRAPRNGHINYSFCCLLPNLLAFAQKNECEKFTFSSLGRLGMPTSVVAFAVFDLIY